MRLNLFRALCALAAIASLVAFAGCGGSDSKSSSTSSYKSDAQKVANDFKTSAQQASQQVQSANTLDERVKGLEALKKSVDDAANGFDNLTPPDNVKADHDRLVAGFRSLSSDVGDVEDAVKTSDQAAARKTLPKLQADQQKVEQAVQSLESKLGS
jgi:hypothetical protein